MTVQIQKFKYRHQAYLLPPETEKVVKFGNWQA